MDSYYHDVNGWLTVGCDLDLARAWLGLTHSETIGQLSDHGVTHVLDVRIECNDRETWVDAGMLPTNYAWCPITDDGNHRPDELWYRGVESFVRQFLDERDMGDRLYVHCHMGVNRGPSAAMLALLTHDPDMYPYDAFLAIREARSIAGLVYAEHVGARHIANRGEAAEAYDHEIYGDVGDFRALIRSYWTPEMRQVVNKDIRYFHDAEAGTIVLGADA